MPEAASWIRSRRRPVAETPETTDQDPLRDHARAQLSPMADARPEPLAEGVPSAFLLLSLYRARALAIGRTGVEPSSADLLASVAATLALPLPDQAPDLLTLRHGVASATLARGLTPEVMARHQGFGHPTDFSLGLLGPVPHTGTSLEVLAGAALAFRLNRAPRVALLLDDVASTDSGDWHEGLNFAAVRRAPLIVILARSSRGEGRRRGSISRKGNAYGVRVDRVESADVEALQRSLARIVSEVRRDPRTRLVELGPTPDDALAAFESRLIERGDVTPRVLESLRAETDREAAAACRGIAA